jgi:2-(1,2-epoxy-1,2-dihydrophenyl)acetyl-CoA isomerase
MNESQEVLYEVTDRVALITLNRPERLNALTPSMLVDLARLLGEASDSDEVRAVVLTGAGRGFCSGQDLSGRTLTEGAAPPEGEAPSVADRRYSMRGIQRVGRAVQMLDKPYIAAINGAAAGAGMDLASMTDIRFMAEGARVTQAYSRNGIVPGNGGCYFLPRIVGMAKALELMWTSRAIEAAEALAIGYVSRVVAPEQLLDETLAFAHELAAGPPVAIQYMKQLCYKSQDVDFDTALRMAQWMQTIAASTQDAIEGANAVRERRPPAFTGR